MAFGNSTLFLLTPAPSDGVAYDTIAKSCLKSAASIALPQSIIIPPKSGRTRVNLYVKAVCLHEGLRWSFKIVPHANLGKIPVRTEGVVVDLGYRGTLYVTVSNSSENACTLPAGVPLFVLENAYGSPSRFEMLEKTDRRRDRYL